MTAQKLVIGTTLYRRVVGSAVRGSAGQMAAATDPKEAGILTLFSFPVWCLLVVLGLLIGRKAGLLVTGGKRVAQG